MVTDRPVLEDSYHNRLMDAFWKLSTCRQIADGVCGPIPYSAIMAFADTYLFNTDEIEMAAFELAITSMDNVFLDHQRKEVESTRQAARREAGMRGAPRKGGVGRRG